MTYDPSISLKHFFVFRRIFNYTSLGILLLGFMRKHWLEYCHCFNWILLTAKIEKDLTQGGQESIQCASIAVCRRCCSYRISVLQFMSLTTMKPFWVIEWQAEMIFWRKETTVYLTTQPFHSMLLTMYIYSLMISSISPIIFSLPTFESMALQLNPSKTSSLRLYQNPLNTKHGLIPLLE